LSSRQYSWMTAAHAALLMDGSVGEQQMIVIRRSCSFDHVGAVFGPLIRNQSAENIARLWCARRFPSAFPAELSGRAKRSESALSDLFRVKCLRALASVPTGALLGCFFKPGHSFSTERGPTSIYCVGVVTRSDSASANVSVRWGWRRLGPTGASRARGVDRPILWTARSARRFH
jgi:hypothetical protein